MSFLKPLLVLVLMVASLMYLLSGNSIERPPGVLAPNAPTQARLENAKGLVSGEFTMVPVATYAIDARVLSVESYSSDDGALLSPIDFAVGWGAMSDTSVIDHFKITQSVRFYTIHPDEQALDVPTALRLSANMHLIPADSDVKKTLEKARPGNVVNMKGYLVTASRQDGFVWNTSLTREDSGAGACELMYVQSVSLR